MATKLRVYLDTTVVSAAEDPLARERRARLLARADAISVVTTTADMHALAQDYVRQGIIPAAYEDDAMHIAAAVLSGQDILASWNFRHMVNRRRRAMVNLLNSSRGLRTIEILSPPEL